MSGECDRCGMMGHVESQCQSLLTGWGTQPTGGQPNPELVDAVMRESMGMVPLSDEDAMEVPWTFDAFGFVWGNGRQICHAPNPWFRERIVRLHNASLAGFDPDAARESEVA